MHRRDLLAWIAAVTGYALVGGAEAVPGAAPAAPDAVDADAFDARERALLDEVAELILPRTDTPGARDAGVGAFMARYASAAYTAAQRDALRAGLADLDARMRAAAGTGFLEADAAQRGAVLAELAHAARAVAAAAHATPHYFTLLQQLTLLGFFTSEVGITQVGRYVPIPGDYHGCVPYTAGESFWAR